MIGRYKNHGKAKWLSNTPSQLAKFYISATYIICISNITGSICFTIAIACPGMYLREAASHFSRMFPNIEILLPSIYSKRNECAQSRISARSGNIRRGNRNCHSNFASEISECFKCG